MRRHSKEAVAQPSGAELLESAELGPAGELRLSRVFGGRTRYTGILWLITVLAFPASRLASSSFPSASLAKSTITLGLFLALVGFGQGLVMLMGGIDLSVAAMVTMGAFAAGDLSAHGYSALVSVVVALVLCAAVGALMGIAVAVAGFPPFVVTMAFASILASLLLGVSGPSPAQPSPSVLTTLFSGAKSWLGLPLTVWFFVVLALIGVAVQHGTRFGRHAYAIGNSQRAARTAGIGVRRTIVLGYTFVGLAYGLAGVMLLGYSSGADLNVGSSWLLPSIAVVIVGGSSMKGGAGTFVGTLGGALLLTIVQTDIGALGVSEGYQQVLYGVIIALALLVQAVTGRRT